MAHLEIKASKPEEQNQGLTGPSSPETSTNVDPNSNSYMGDFDCRLHRGGDHAQVYERWREGKTS